MDKPEPPQSVVLGFAWTAIGGAALLLLIANSQNVAALFMAASVIVALPPLEDTLLRYGTDGRKRIWICLISAAVSGAFALQQPDDLKPENSENAALQESVDSNSAGDREPISLETVSNCYAIDGDTLKCGVESLRLLGIDAPEMSGCEEGRICVGGDPMESRNSLQTLSQDLMEIERVGQDKYGRTLAMVYINGVSLSCHQLALRNAVYVEQWDDGERVASECESDANGQALPPTL